MINTSQIEIARKHFELAAKEFGFTFISPYCIDKDSETYIFGYIEGYGSKYGAAFSLISPPSYDEDVTIRSFMERHHPNMFYSSLNIELLVGDYDPLYFQELLGDWKITQT